MPARAPRVAGYDPTSITALDHLALVGSDGSGTLKYSGLRLEPFEAPTVDFETAAALIGKALEEDNRDRIRTELALTG